MGTIERDSQLSKQLSMARRLSTGLLLLLTFLLVGCDHATKHVAELTLRGGDARSIVPGILDLRYAENGGIAFSAFHAWGSTSKPLVLGILAMSVLAVLVVCWVVRWPRAGRVEQMAYAVLVAGAVGNAIDRFARGYVIDFIHVRAWPVFNVADICVVMGMGLLVLAGRSRRALHGAPGGI
jgi:signal peptidase II